GRVTRIGLQLCHHGKTPSVFDGTSEERSGRSSSVSKQNWPNLASVAIKLRQFIGAAAHAGTLGIAQIHLVPSHHMTRVVRIPAQEPYDTMGNTSDRQSLKQAPAADMKLADQPFAAVA